MFLTLHAQPTGTVPARRSDGQTEYRQTEKMMMMMTTTKMTTMMIMQMKTTTTATTTTTTTIKGNRRKTNYPQAIKSDVVPEVDNQVLPGLTRSILEEVGERCLPFRPYLLHGQKLDVIVVHY